MNLLKNIFFFKKTQKKNKKNMNLKYLFTVFFKKKSALSFVFLLEMRVLYEIHNRVWKTKLRTEAVPNETFRNKMKSRPGKMNFMQTF